MLTGLTAYEYVSPADSDCERLRSEYNGLIPHPSASFVFERSLLIDKAVHSIGANKACSRSKVPQRRPPVLRRCALEHRIRRDSLRGRPQPLRVLLPTLRQHPSLILRQLL